MSDSWRPSCNILSVLFSDKFIFLHLKLADPSHMFLSYFSSFYLDFAIKDTTIVQWAPYYLYLLQYCYGIWHLMNKIWHIFLTKWTKILMVFSFVFFLGTKFFIKMWKNNNWGCHPYKRFFLSFWKKIEKKKRFWDWVCHI